MKLINVKKSWIGKRNSRLLFLFLTRKSILSTGLTRGVGKLIRVLRFFPDSSSKNRKVSSSGDNDVSWGETVQWKSDYAFFKYS